MLPTETQLFSFDEHGTSMRAVSPRNRDLAVGETSFSGYGHAGYGAVPEASPRRNREIAAGEASFMSYGHPVSLAVAEASSPRIGGNGLRETSPMRAISPRRYGDVVADDPLGAEDFDCHLADSAAQGTTTPRDARIVASQARLVSAGRSRGRGRGRGARPSSAPSAHAHRNRQLEVRCQVQECVATSSRLRDDGYPGKPSGPTYGAHCADGRRKDQVVAAAPVVRFCPWCSAPQPEHQGAEVLTRCTGCRRVFNPSQAKKWRLESSAR